jgi:hypothetical protein
MDKAQIFNTAAAMLNPRRVALGNRSEYGAIEVRPIWE